jgi:HlyD family secretion protein
VSITESILGVARGLIAGRRRWYLAAVLLVAATFWFWARDNGEGRADDYITVPVERGSLKNSVAATGTVQAVLTVQVGSQVTGRIASLHADFNSVVTKGQILARIDPANFEAQLDSARADLNDARAGIRTAEAAVANQKANLQAAKVAAQDAQRALTKAEELSQERIVSTRDLEMAQSTNDQAAARVDQSVAAVRSAEAALEQSKARVDQAQAAVKVAEINRHYTVITSPVDGVVISRSVDVGQTVSASLQAPTLFTIANDLTKMQVVASVDEADIGSITPQAKVSFTVDAFPGETFSGDLNQIRLNPEAQQNVVTYNVIVDVANPDLKLRPGMTANTTFTIAERQEVLKVANAALRYWPEGVSRDRERELIAQSVPEGGGRRGAEQRTGPTGGEAKPEAGGRPDPPAGHRTSRPVTPVETGPEPSGTGIDAGTVIRFPAARRSVPRPRVVWILGSNHRPQPHVVQVGISDGSSSEIVEGDLKAGDPVIVGRNVSPDAQAGAQGRGPFAPAMGGRRR